METYPTAGNGELPCLTCWPGSNALKWNDTKKCLKIMMVILQTKYNQELNQLSSYTQFNYRSKDRRQ